MNCCGGAEKEKASEKTEKREEKEAHRSHGAHGGCGMHGGGFMRWLWIGLLVYVIASFVR